MPSIIFMVLRRLRLPLIVLIVAYAVAMTGLVLAPGVDPEGRPWTLSFFHAFYIISYTATTIGFGEIPYPLSDAQRAWVIITIYTTVVAWLYSIGSILTLLQEPGFRAAVVFNHFVRRVRQITDPFYVICGYGETGSLLVQALDRQGLRPVVLDIDPVRLAELELADHTGAVLGLTADASAPDNLIAAGIRNPLCRGVVALTNDDRANLAVAVTIKLLRPDLPVLCRAETREVAANMASFNTDHIINPFEVFSDHFAMAIIAPGTFLLQEWLLGGTELSCPKQPIHPPDGRWLICGYGRFGRAIEEHLSDEGIETRIIEADPERTGCDHCVTGRGTEAATLLEAGVEKAVGLVAGTNDDIDNLSVVMTARDLNTNLFVVLRKNRQINAPLFSAIGADLLMEPARIVSQACLIRLTNPLLAHFLSHCRGQDNDWANELTSRLAGLASEGPLETWSVSLGREHTPALATELHRRLPLDALLRDPARRDEHLPCLPLMLARVRGVVLLPEPRQELESHDRLLFCGTRAARSRQAMALFNINALRYVLHGDEGPDGTIWRWLEARLRSP